ncbi:hypothetical protein AXF42_Ash021574 [Apostasia shenzhenica]|uniref:Uncharacterized protein n=1 Tax=Apostasia shenzhenica TaxID=1088818 RepID=A0A2H9ZYL2_9ASPA|nr:hypothetical protein AXF42_Ash021574 [Apostasia shenzhenica]
MISRGRPQELDNLKNEKKVMSNASSFSPLPLLPHPNGASGVPLEVAIWNFDLKLRAVNEFSIANLLLENRVVTTPFSTNGLYSGHQGL